MALRIFETTEGHFVCEHGKPGLTMVATVPFICGCETCIRQAYTEALERTLKESNFGTPEHGG